MTKWHPAQSGLLAAAWAPAAGARGQALASGRPLRGCSAAASSRGCVGGAARPLAGPLLAGHASCARARVRWASRLTFPKEPMPSVLLRRYIPIWTGGSAPTAAMVPARSPAASAKPWVTSDREHARAPCPRPQAAGGRGFPAALAGRRPSGVALPGVPGGGRPVSSRHGRQGAPLRR